MSLLRVAFECEDGVIQLAVLCSGCYADVLVKIESKKRWTRDLNTGACDFCMAEVRSIADG